MSNLINIPNTLHVIKNKNKMYTTVINKKHYICTFIEKKTSYSCIKFLTQHKQKYGIWPLIDSYSNNNKVELKELINNKKGIDYISNSIYVEKYNLDFFKIIASVTNLGIMAISDFDYILSPSKINIIVKGSDITNDLVIDKSDLLNLNLTTLNNLYELDNLYENTDYNMLLKHEIFNLSNEGIINDINDDDIEYL
jgi:hypothetical protein